MPRNNVPAPRPTTAPLELPDDVREELLRAQSGALENANVALPRVKIMGAGAGLFEFENEDDTPRTFDGIILGYHAQNVLWDKPYGAQRTTEEEKFPACAAPDGVTGFPRLGFDHRGLGRVAAEGDSVACKGCAYNAWQTASLVGKSGKGKACTNQMAVYVMLGDRAMPVHLTLPPTSLGAFNEYLMSLINRQMPVQAVLTTFSQERRDNNGLVWSEARFTQARPLSREEFDAAMARRATFKDAMTPRRYTVEATGEDQPSF